MKKNLYFRDVAMRRSLFLKFFLTFFQALSSYPRLILEVFIRKNFGERYFSIASVITVTLLLIAYPVYEYKSNPYLYGSSDGGYYGAEKHSFLLDYASWFLFIAAFLYFSYLRWQEVKRNPSTFDFGRYSLASGDLHPAFFQIKINGQKPSLRRIETLYEPLAFFIIGILLIFLSQTIGYIITISSIFYSLGYVASYRSGDDFALDKIDEMIMNEELADSFSVEEDTGKRGVRFYMKKPTKAEMREKLADSFIEEDRNVGQKIYAE